MSEPKEDLSQPRPPDGSSSPGGEKASPILTAVLVAYTVLLAAAAASEIFDLGWFDWLVRYP